MCSYPKRPHSSLSSSGLILGYGDDDDEPRSRAFSTPEPKVTPDGPEAPEATTPSADAGEETEIESVGETAEDRSLDKEVRLSASCWFCRVASAVPVRTGAFQTSNL